MSHRDRNTDMVFAESIRQACVEKAREGFRHATISGLCAEGAMEAAVSAIQTLDIEKFVDEYNPASGRRQGDA